MPKGIQLKILIIGMISVAMSLTILPGCGGSDQDGSGKNPPANLREMDYATFKAKVLSHQVEAVVIYPQEQVLTTVATDSGQIYTVKYDDLAITASGTSLTKLLADNNVPFKVEEPSSGGRS